MHLEDFDAAIHDFTFAILTDSWYGAAYYDRAFCFAKLNEYAQAMDDLRHQFEIDASFSPSYILRGQIRIDTGDSAAGCKDFWKAKALGSTQAGEPISRYCTGLPKQETLLLDWAQEPH